MNSSRYITVLAALTWICLAALNAGAHTWLDGTPRFHENAIFLAQTLGHYDRAMLAPALADAIPPAVYKVDDEHSFYATNMRNGAQYSLTASCRAVSDRAYIFLESGRSADSGKLTSLLNAFDGIYDSITGQFGFPPDSIDGDPRVYILLLDVIDDKREDGSQITGYFDPLNQYRNDQLPRWTRERSNEVEMFYVDYTALDFKPNGAESVVAHEFTHLVQWARDPEESIWVDEGIAIYSEAMLGYEVGDLISAFEDRPDTPLLNWYDSLADYGAAYLFFKYVSERFGGTPAIASVVKNKDQGAEGIEQALAGQGVSISFPDLFSDWVIANYLDDPNLNDGIYGYVSIDVDMKPSIMENIYPIDTKAFMIEPWSAHYIEFSKGQDDALDITVSNSSWWDDIIAQVIEFGSETSVLPVKLGETSSGTVLVSQENRKTVLVVTSQPDPPESRRRFSSYAYSAEVKSAITSVAPVSGMKITTWGVIKRD